MDNERVYDECGIACDLLPLYTDNVCSEGSKRFVERHIAKCEGCRASLEEMRSVGAEQLLEKEKNSAIALHGKRRDGRIMKSIFLAIAAAYIPLIFLAPLFAGGNGLAPTNYLFRLLVVFLYSFPFLTAVISLGFTVSKVINGGIGASGPRAFDVVAAASAVLTLICCVNLDTLLYPALFFSVVSIVALTVTAVKNKRNGHNAPLNQKTFWFCFFVVFTVFLAIIIAFTAVVSTGGRRPEKDEYASAYSFCFFEGRVTFL